MNECTGYVSTLACVPEVEKAARAYYRATLNLKIALRDRPKSPADRKRIARRRDTVCALLVEYTRVKLAHTIVARCACCPR